MKQNKVEESKEISKDNVIFSSDNIKNIKRKKKEHFKITNKGIIKRLAYAESISPLKGLTKDEKKKEIKMSEEEKERNRRILQSMNLKLAFKRNPRFKEVPVPHDINNIQLDDIDSKQNPFFVDPKEVVFHNFQLGCIYQIDIKILNRTQLLTSFKYIPPMTENFAIKNIIYPKKDSSLIAPGMFAKMQIIFNPTVMENFNDELIIITERLSFRIPLKGVRDKAALSLVNPMNCQKCFIGDKVEMHFNCRNNGGDAHFKFSPCPDEPHDNNDELLDEYDSNNKNENNSNELLSLGPFTVFPQEFYLYKGMIQTITVNFAPDKEGIIEKNICIVCNSSSSVYTLKGEGIKVDIEVKMLDGLNLKNIALEKETSIRPSAQDKTGMKSTKKESASLKNKSATSMKKSAGKTTNKDLDTQEDKDKDKEKEGEVDQGEIGAEGEKKEEEKEGEGGEENKDKNEQNLEDKNAEEKKEAAQDEAKPENEKIEDANDQQNPPQNDQNEDGQGVPNEEDEEEQQNDNDDNNEDNQEINSHGLENDLSSDNDQIQEIPRDNDISLDKFDKLTNIFFKDTYPFTSTSRVLVLQNTSSVSIKFHWTIYDVYNSNDFCMLPDENFYSIEPEDGVFEPFQEKTFTIKFTPLNSKIYEQKLDLVIENIPFPAIKQFSSVNANIKNSFTKAEPYLPGFNSSFPSYPLYSFNLKGQGKIPYIECDKSVIDLGDVYLGNEVYDSFQITNPKTGVCKFKVSKILQKILTKKINNIDDNDDLNSFYKDNCLDDDLIIKNKINFQNKMIAITNDLNDKNEYKTNLEFTNVNYLNIKTQEKNFVEYILNNQNNQNNNNNSLKNLENIPVASSVQIENTIQKLKKKKSRIDQGKGSQSKMNKCISTKSIKDSECNYKMINLPLDQYIQINKGQSIEFKISFKGDKLGIFKSTIIFVLEDGKTITVDIKANIIGPKLVINTPYLDFGLFQVSKVQNLNLEIENITPIPLKYFIKEQRYKDININNFKDFNYIEEFEGVFKENEIKNRNKIESILDYDNQYMEKYDIEKIDSYKLKYSSVYGELNPYEKKIITVSFYSPYPIHIFDNNKNTLEIQVENSDNLYINYTAQCEESNAYIDNVYIIPKEIFLTMPIVHNDNTINIINPSNLPIHFKWENKFEADHLIAEFEPNEGEIAPHSKIGIKYKIIYFFIDHIDDMFICNIKEIDVPLGVILIGDVIGLDIGYELTEETYELIDAINNSTGLTMSTIKFDSKDESKSKQDEEDEEIKKKKEKERKRRKTMLLAKGEVVEEKANKMVPNYTLTNLSIRNLKVNSPAEFFFKIKNLSGIPTHYNLSVANYPPGKEKAIKIDKDQTATSITKLSKISKKTSKSKSQNFKIDHLLLSAEHEKVNFTSPKGQEFTKMKQIEEDSILYLSNNKGLALVLEPKKGKLGPHGEILIKLSIFNECVGEFHDVLTSNIKGLPAVNFPIDLRIKGNPLQLSPFQPGINYLLDPALLQMGNVLRNGGTLTKNVRIVNIGTNRIGLDWKIYDYEDYEKPDPQRDIVDLQIVEKTIGNFSLAIKGFPPKEFEEKGKYFSIEPENSIVGPKSYIDFNVSFKTDIIGEKNALFIAYPYVEGDIERKVQFNELPLKAMGNGLIPHLTVDKYQNMDSNYSFKFTVHSYGMHPKIKRPIVLINKEKINLVVRLTIEGPFRIEGVDPYEAVMGNNIYSIIPNSNLKVDIKFLCPNPQNEEEWPMTLLNVRDGKLIVEYENGECEIFILKAILKRPRILLSFSGNESIESLDYIDFGYVNCSTPKIVKMYLMNETDVDTNWEIKYVKFIPKKVYGYGTVTKFEKEDMEMIDDNSVFDFDVSGGVIYGPTSLLTNLPIAPALPKVEVDKNKKYKPLVIKCIFRPKKNVFYKCRYRIVTSTGNCIDFILKGFGSYLEEHLIE